MKVRYNISFISTAIHSPMISDHDRDFDEIIFPLSGGIAERCGMLESSSDIISLTTFFSSL